MNRGARARTCCATHARERIHPAGDSTRGICILTRECSRSATKLVVDVVRVVFGAAMMRGFPNVVFLLDTRARVKGVMNAIDEHVCGSFSELRIKYRRRVEFKFVQVTSLCYIDR